MLLYTTFKNISRQQELSKGNSNQLKAVAIFKIKTPFL